MTSANVIEYTIYRDGENVGSHRQNIMCKSNYKDLLKFEPLSEHTIITYGYDEEEEYWEDDEENLENFLKKIGEKEIRDYFNKN